MTYNNIRTIIIDDETESRYLLESMLTKYPEVELLAQADDAASGLELIIQLHPDLVFLDIRMPTMTGLDLVKELSNHKLRTTIVFVSAYDKFAIRAIKLTTFDYLLKPINPEDIQRVIERMKTERPHHADD